MSFLTVSAGAAPATPVAGKATQYLDSADGLLKSKGSDGRVARLTGGGLNDNLVINGGFALAQRQVFTTLTTYSNTSGRAYSADRWGITNENTSAQYQSVLADAPETGLRSRYYGRFKKITSTGKLVVSQPIESFAVAPLRGRAALLSFKARYTVTASMTMRAVVLQLTASGTVDTLPGTFISAFGANGTDPTWGTNLSPIAPRIVSGTGSSIVGQGLTAVLAATWQRYTMVLDVPSDCKNLVVVFFGNSQLAANDELNLAEVSLTDGETPEDWVPRSIVDELQLCQRYYAKTFAIAVAPAQNAGVTTGCLRGILGKAGATALAAQMQWQFPVTMRITPAITSYNPGATNAQVRQISGTAGDLTATASPVVTDRCVDITATGIGTGAVGDQVGIHLSADAEI